jgi:hypothetical protein
MPRPVCHPRLGLAVGEADRHERCPEVVNSDGAARVDEAFSAQAIAYMQQMAASDEAFARAMTRTPVEDFTRSDVVALLGDPSFRWVLDRATHFRDLLPQLVEEGERLCNERTWQVWVTPPSGPFFIIPDTPISLVEERRSEERGGGALDDLTRMGELTIVPLSYRTALVGHPRARGERLTEMGVGLAPVDAVAHINGRLINEAQRFVWSVEPEFFVWDNGLVSSDVVLHGTKRAVKTRKRVAQREARRRVRRIRLD